MKLDDFKSQYRCEFDVVRATSTEFIALTKAIVRETGEMFDVTQGAINFPNFNEKISDSNTQVSLAPVTWDDCYESIKRTQLNLLLIRASVEEILTPDADTSSFYV